MDVLDEDCLKAHVSKLQKLVPDTNSTPAAVLGIWTLILISLQLRSCWYFKSSALTTENVLQGTRATPKRRRRSAWHEAAFIVSLLP